MLKNLQKNRDANVNKNIVSKSFVKCIQLYKTKQCLKLIY